MVPGELNALKFESHLSQVESGGFLETVSEFQTLRVKLSANVVAAEMDRTTGPESLRSSSRSYACCHRSFLVEHGRTDILEEGGLVSCEQVSKALRRVEFIVLGGAGHRVYFSL